MSTIPYDLLALNPLAGITIKLSIKLGMRNTKDTLTMGSGATLKQPVVNCDRLNVKAIPRPNRMLSNLTVNSTLKNLRSTKTSTYSHGTQTFLCYYHI
jgi:hypothetical protein